MSALFSGEAEQIDRNGKFLGQAPSEVLGILNTFSFIKTLFSKHENYFIINLKYGNHLNWDEGTGIKGSNAYVLTYSRERGNKTMVT